jgi:hypothetical protein
MGVDGGADYRLRLIFVAIHRKDAEDFSGKQEGFGTFQSHFELRAGLGCSVP